MKLLFCFTSVLAVLVSLSFAQSPATQPDAAGDGELMQSKTQMAGNGAERYRLISRPDEIVSVLHNGMTVIVKRVPTPVVAVRGLRWNRRRL